MEITGKLIQITNPQEGTSQRGAWRKATAVFETDGEYPKKIAIDFWNSDLETVANIPLGTACKVRFDVESREYNGRWYTNCKAFHIEAQVQQPATNDFDKPLPPLNEPQQPAAATDDNDDLPF